MAPGLAGGVAPEATVLRGPPGRAEIVAGDRHEAPVWFCIERRDSIRALHSEGATTAAINSCQIRGLRENVGLKCGPRPSGSAHMEANV